MTPQAAPVPEPLALDRGLRLLPALWPYLRDPLVTEIMVNEGGRKVFVEREGLILLTPVTIDPTALRLAIKTFGRATGKEANADACTLTTRLRDGSRLAALLAPQAVDGDTMTIRRFTRRYTLEELVAAGTLSAADAARLVRAVEDRWTILVAGATGTGKTTLVNALAAYIPPDQRILTIEDVCELHLTQPNVVRFEARPAESFDAGDRPRRAISLADLLKEALRHRPDRLILGEVRLEEAKTLLAALSTGHQGSFSTLHAKSAPAALVALRHLVLANDPGGTRDETVREAITNAVDLVVHLGRDNAARKVTEIYDVTADRRRSRQPRGCRVGR